KLSTGIVPVQASASKSPQRAARCSSCSIAPAEPDRGYANRRRIDQTGRRLHSKSSACAATRRKRALAVSGLNPKPQELGYLEQPDHQADPESDRLAHHRAPVSPCRGGADPESQARQLRTKRILGHRNIQTTINFYVGLETTQATQEFGEMI